VSDLKTATSATPKVLVSNYLPSSEAAQYTAAAGSTVRLASAVLVNTDSSARTVTLSIVKTGDSAGGANRILNAYSLAAGAVLDLGAVGWLGPGDFISGVASVASKVTLVMSGVEFSSATVGVAAGIQTDAMGTGGRTASSGTVTGTNTIGTGNNRYLLAALMVTHQSGSVGYASYDTLTMSCTAGAMTRLVSCDYNQSGNFNGSVHLFGRANPTSSSTQTLTANVVESGVTFNLTLASMSLSGVASVTGAATSGPSSAAALSLAVSSASGHRPVFAAGFYEAPMDFNQRVRAFNGNSAIGLSVPHWLIMADALGAGTVTATTSNSQFHCAVGLDLVPA